MAVTKKTSLALFGIAVLLGAVVVWYITMEHIMVRYREAAAAWRINEICKDGQTGKPIRNAKVTVYWTTPVERQWGN